MSQPPSASDQPYLSVVIPAYQEAAKIAADLRAACDYFGPAGYPFEVIVVDDGSRDATAAEVERFAAAEPRVRLIRYAANRGKGYAVRTGVLDARGEVVLFADAGSCVPYENVERGLALLRGGCDVALGSRALQGSVIRLRQPRYRQLGSRVFHWLVHQVMGVGDVQDTQCGFKLFRRDVAQVLFGASRIDGFMFDVEIIVGARRLGLHLAEFPVTWSNDPDTKFRPLSGSVRNARELLRIKLGALRPAAHLATPVRSALRREP